MMSDEVTIETAELQIVPWIFGAITVLSIVGLLQSRKTNRKILKIISDRPRYMPPDIVFAPTYSGSGKLNPAPVHAGSYVYTQIGFSYINAGDQVVIEAIYTYTIGQKKYTVPLQNQILTGTTLYHVYDQFQSAANWGSLTVSGEVYVRRGGSLIWQEPFCQVVF